MTERIRTSKGKAATAVQEYRNELLIEFAHKKEQLSKKIGQAIESGDGAEYLRKFKLMLDGEEMISAERFEEVAAIWTEKMYEKHDEFMDMSRLCSEYMFTGVLANALK